MALLRYAKFYKFIYELPPGDKPSDTLIESDSEIDLWYEGFVRQTERSYMKHRKGTNTVGHRREADQNRIPTFDG